MLGFLCFSLKKFATAGVGEVHPVTTAARVCAVGEMAVAYFTTVLVIANVGCLQTVLTRGPDPETRG